MAEKFTKWDPVDHLATNEDMAIYLEACLDDDPLVVLGVPRDC